MTVVPSNYEDKDVCFAEFVFLFTTYGLIRCLMNCIWKIELEDMNRISNVPTH